MNPISAMVSYAWADADAAELLHVELALRGFSVFHDRCSFEVGTRLHQNMSDAVARCDGFVGYFTPASLYLGKPPDSPRPAIDDEFKPIMARRRDASVGQDQVAPVVIALSHGLGDPRSDAPTAIRRATGEDVSSLWMPVTLDQSTAGLTQAEAANVARCLLGAVLKDAHRAASPDPLEVSFCTRGDGQPPAFVTIDATMLVGGSVNRPGSAPDWERTLLGLTDLQTSLARWTTERRMVVRPRAHLSGCIAFGRVFNQAAGWHLEALGRHGRSAIPPALSDHTDLRFAADRSAARGDVSVEVDLIGGNVRELANNVIAELPDALSTRLQITRHGDDDLQPAEVGAMAGQAAREARQCIADTKPERVHLFCATAADFAVLFASRLTSLHADLHLYERVGDRYVPSLVIPQTLP